MKAFYKLLFGLLFAYTLTGCIGEDYDVGVPTAHLQFENSFLSSVQLTEANISWETASEDVQKSIKDIEKYAASLDEIMVFPGQKTYLDFEENEKNGGDIWTDPQVSAVLLKDDEPIEIVFGTFVNETSSERLRPVVANNLNISSFRVEKREWSRSK